MPVALEHTLADASLIAYGMAVVALLLDYLLVGCRLLGLLVTVPGCNPSTVPWQLRAILLIVMAGMITPNVSVSAQAALRPQDERFAASRSGNMIQPVAHAESRLIDEMPVDVSAGSFNSSPALSDLTAVMNFLGLAAGELGLGFLLGIGANLVLQGFRMAGQLIDQQTGLGLVASTSLDSENGGSAFGELLFWLGNLLLLLLSGHLLLVSTVLQTFRTFPPGCSSAPLELLPVVLQLFRQSLSLALQLSAPVLAAQVLVGLAVAHASCVAPQFQNAGAGGMLKLLVPVGVLTLSLTGITERLIDVLPDAQQTVLQAIQP